MKYISGMRDSRCSDTPTVTRHEHEGRHKSLTGYREHPRQTKDITVEQERNLSVLPSASLLSYRAWPTVSTKSLPWIPTRKRSWLAPVTRTVPYNRLCRTPIYTVSLLFALSCSFLCSNYVFYVFNYSFYVCFLVLCVLLSSLCVRCVCVFFLCTVSPHVNSCLLSICVQLYRMETQLQLTFRRRNFFFNFCTPVYKMCIIQEPYTLELWNILHFKIFSTYICWINI